MREGGDCPAVSVVTGGDVAQRRSFLAVEGGELFRGQFGGQGREGGCCRGWADVGRVQCQHVTNGLGRAVQLPGHRAERLSVFDELVQRRDVDGVGIGAGQHQQRTTRSKAFGRSMLRHHDTTGACHGAVTPMGRRQRVGCLRHTPPSGRIGCLSIKFKFELHLNSALRI